MKKLLWIVFFLSVFTNKDSAQIITTIAGNGISGNSGDGGQATNAELLVPAKVKSDRHGRVFFGDLSTRYRAICANGIINSIAGDSISGCGADGIPATVSALIGSVDVVVNEKGVVFFTDLYRIRKIDTSGIVSTVAGNCTSVGCSGDGGPATAATFWSISAIALDKIGNLFVADENNCVRKIDTNGIITVYAGIPDSAGYDGDGGMATLALLNSPYGLATDKNGNLFIADYNTGTIRKVSTDGIITTVAGHYDLGWGYSGDGGPATDAGVSCFDVAVDKTGNLFIADNENYRIRKVDTNGIISTYAGSGLSGFGGDGGQATTARIDPCGVAVDTFGNLYIADDINSRIRKVINDQQPMSLT